MRTYKRKASIKRPEEKYENRNTDKEVHLANASCPKDKSNGFSVHTKKSRCPDGTKDSMQSKNPG